MVVAQLWLATITVLSWTCHWSRAFYSLSLVSDKVLEWQHPPWLPTYPPRPYVRFLQASHLLPSLSLMAQFWGSHSVIYCDLWWEIYIWSSSCLGHKAPKSLGISYVIKKNRAVLILIANPFQPQGSLPYWGDCGTAPKNGVGCQGRQPCDWRIGTFSPTPLTSKEGEELEVELLGNGQWFNQSFLCNDASRKPQNYGVKRASRLVNTWRFGESSLLWWQRSAEAFPHPSPCHLSIWLFLSYLLLLLSH